MEALLPRRVPYLQRHNVPVPYFNLLFNEVCAYGGLLGEARFLVLEALDDACFADAGVADDYDFEEGLAFGAGV